jgi:hypothetical protein
MTPSTDFPADLVGAYRQLALSRERDWLHPSSEAAWDYRSASRAIRLHPFWRTLPDPAAVAAAGRALREISVLPSEDSGVPVVPYVPLERDPDVPAQEGERIATDALSEYAAQLDAAGLWDRLPEPVRAQERRNVELTGYDLRHGLDYRDRQFFADGEYLFECGVEALFDELAPSLAECGLALDVVALSDPYPDQSPPGGEEYILEINGVCCAVWTAEDELNQASGWHVSVVRPLIVINELLEVVGARERVYAELAADCIYLLPAEARAVLVNSELSPWKPSSLMLMERGLWQGEPEA